MKREILYKGLRSDGKGWVEGHVYPDQVFKAGIPCVDVTYIRDECHEDFEVRPETVCQLAKVNNDKQFFEGDTFKVWLKDTVEEEGGSWWNCHIELHQGCWCLLQTDFDYRGTPAEQCELLFETDYDLVPTGNIHDKSK